MGAVQTHCGSAHVLFAINEFEDLEDKFVVDLGVGGGILGIGASLLGARRILGLDVDNDALDICKQNCEKLDVEVELLQCDISKISVKDKQIFGGTRYFLSRGS
jgi:predicted RNA methylase